MLGCYTPPVCAGESFYGLRMTGSDDPIVMKRPNDAGNAQAADPKTAAQELAKLRRSIAEAQNRTSAFATIIADKVRAGENTEELERKMLAEMDRLLILRLDYGALCFLGGTHGDPID